MNKTRETGNIRDTRYRTKTNQHGKVIRLPTRTKQKPGVYPGTREGKQYHDDNKFRWDAVDVCSTGPTNLVGV
jgi:hypothetical protein